MIIGYINHDFHKALFLFSVDNPSIEEQLYMFMKRFRTQPSEFFAMNRELRLSLYKRELDLLMEEYKEAEKMRNAK